MESYHETEETELDELEDIMRVRNALSDKARDELNDQRKP